MACKNCDSERVASVGGKCSDMFNLEMGKVTIEGYVPDDLGIGGGDYLEFKYCLDCGQIQGDWPLPETGAESDQADFEEDEPE